MSNNLIPAKKAEYIAFGHHDDIDTVMRSKLFYPVFITGDTGNGKSEMVEQVCAINERAMYRVNFNAAVDEDSIIGTKTLKDGNIEIVYGAVLQAMMTGSILLLDEITAANPNTILCLQPILEGKPYYFKLTNEMICPKDGFNIFATDNTKGRGSVDGRYVGTNVMNEAFLERFAATFEQQYPPKDVETKILRALCEKLVIDLDTHTSLLVDDLVKWAEAIRKARDDGVADIEDIITTRRLLMIVRSYSLFKDENKAIELCIARFDSDTKDSFLKFWGMVRGTVDKKSTLLNADSERM